MRRATGQRRKSSPDERCTVLAHPEDLGPGANRVSGTRVDTTSPEPRSAPMSHHEHDETTYPVTITVRHHDDHTKAKAHLHWRYVDLVGVGDAEIDPDDDYPQAGRRGTRRRTGIDAPDPTVVRHLRRRHLVGHR